MKTNVLNKNLIREVSRNSFSLKHIGIFILRLFAVLYFGFIFFILGVDFNGMCEALVPDLSPIFVLARGLVFYIFIDIILRVFLLDFSLIDFQKYLTHPISRNSIASYLLKLNFFSLINFLPYVFIFTLFVFNTELGFDFWGKMLLFIMFSSILLTNYYSSILLKRLLVKYKFFLFIFIGICGAILFAEYNDYLKITNTLVQLFEAWISPQMLVTQLLGLLFFILLPLPSWSKAFNTLKANMYLDEMKIGGQSAISEISLMDSSNVSNPYYALFMRFILRNKRIRNQLVMGIVIGIPYCIWGYTTDMIGFVMTFFMTQYLIAYIPLSILPYFWGLNAASFSFYMTNMFNLKTFFKHLLIFSTVSCLLLTCLASTFYFINPISIKIVWTCFFINVGFILPSLLLYSSYHTKAVEANKGGSFDVQGFDFKSLIIIMVVSFLPSLVAKTFDVWGALDYGLLLLSILGILGLLTMPLWLKLINLSFHEQKYELFNGFKRERI